MKPRSLVIAIVLIACLGRVGYSQADAQAKTIHLSISHPRPIYEAVRALGKQYSWAITYEDPEYTNAADLRNDRGMTFPAGGTLNFEYPVKNGRPTEDVAHLLTRMLNAYGTGNRPEFTVRHRTLKKEATYWQEWHVVPKKVLDKGGTLADVTPILDTVITIPTERRNTLEMIAAVCNELSQVTNKRVETGMVPLNSLRAYVAEQGATNQPARNILADTLNRSHAAYIWHLLYDPSGFYALNVSGVNVDFSAQPPSANKKPKSQSQ